MNKANMWQHPKEVRYVWIGFCCLDFVLTLVIFALGKGLIFFLIKYLVLGLVLLTIERHLFRPRNDREVWRHIEQQLAYVDFLERINHILVANLDLRENFSRLVCELREQVAFDCCLIYRVDEVRSQYHLYGVFDGTDCLLEKGVAQSLSGSRLSEVVEQRKYQISGEGIPEEDARGVVKRIQGRSTVQIPMIYQNQVIGVFVLGSTDLGYYQPEIMKLLEPVVERVTAALQNSILYEETRELSLKDYLTDLANRRALDLRLEYEYHRARRYQEPFSILVIDVDFFKPFNDTYGHLAGDQALRELAQIMKHEVREVDLVSRFGGEEFVILLPGTTREQASMVAERIRHRVAEHVFLAGTQDAQLTVCIGVGTYAEDVGGIEAILHGADMKLYSAKSCGRNKVIHMT